MLRFVFTRLSLVVPTFIGITLLVFVLVRLIPGDPIETMAGERGIDPARHEQLRKEYGFDRPVLVQYGYYLARLAHGDLGRSVVTHEPVISEFTTLFAEHANLQHLVVTFLALLELSREQLIDIAQAKPYAPIHVQLKGERPFALAAEA